PPPGFPLLRFRANYPRPGARNDQDAATATGGGDMPDLTIKRVEDFDTPLGFFGRARAALGVRAFGMQVMSFPANFESYFEHDHADDGQEEVYTPISGTVYLIVDGEEHELTPGTFARVGPAQRRNFVTRGEPARLLRLRGEHEVRERVLDVALDRTAQRAGAHRRVVALLDEHLLRALGQLDRDLVRAHLLAQALEHQVDDLHDLFLRQLVEDDHLVDPV